MAGSLLQPTEAARRLGTTALAVVHLLQTGKLPYVVVDGFAHVREEAVEEYGTSAEAL
jgi:hypothetical protein